MQEIEAAINTKQAARYLGVTPGTVTVWRARSAGPPCHYSGTKPVYYLGELKEWQRRCAEERILSRRLPIGQTTEVEIATT